MSIFSKLWAVLGSVGRLFAGSKRSVPQDAGVSVPVVVAAATAVAGFVYRVEADLLQAKRVQADRFFLAARLKSVAKLNTPVGRAPRTAVLPQPNKAALPAERIGAKKVRANSGRELRVLTQIQVRNARSAEIIPFPMVRRGALAQSTQVARAA